MIQKLNKKLIFTTIFIVLCLIFTYLTYTLNNPTKFNQFLASVLQQSPANESFDDETFYELVIDTYNYETSSNKAYTDNLTDEELAQITNISSVSPNEKHKITSLKGIEKLLGLTTLNLDEHNITNLDLSHNLNINTLNLSNNNISEINNIIGFNNLTNLQNLSLSNMSLNDINISNFTRLTTLNLTHNNIYEIDLSNNLNLTNLNLSNNNIGELDLSNNSKLTNLDLSNNNISEIDLINNIKLVKLTLNNNSLALIDLINIPNLSNLNLSNNNISEIDLSNNLNLTTLNLSNNSISEIDLSHNLNLTTLNLNNNNLSEIELSNNLNLKNIVLSNNDLSNTSLYDFYFLEQNYYYQKGKEYDFPIKLPKETIVTNYGIENSNVVEIVDNKINSLNSGNSKLYITYRNQYVSSYNVLIGNVHVYDITSNKYNIYNDLDIINVDWDDTSGIINNINIDGDENFDLYIDDNKLKIFSSSNNHKRIIKEYDLVRYYSNKYDLSNGYISNYDNTFNLSDIVASDNLDVVLIDDVVQVLYDNNLIEELPIIKYSSTKYDLSGNYIYIENGNFDVDDIETINCDKDIVDNNLIIKYQDTEILNIPIIRYETDYEVVDNYLYIGTDEINESEINVTNGYINIDNNSIFIYSDKYGKVGTIYLTKLLSTKYDLSKDTIIIEEENDLDEIIVINGEKEYNNNNKLYIKMAGKIVKEYNIEIKKATNSSNNITKTTAKVTSSNLNRLNSEKIKKALDKFEDNAKTYDDIVKYFILSFISILLIIGFIVYIIRKK